MLVSYPKAAIEEALVNAVAHRDYYIDGAQIDIDIFKDRIEITSPGNFILPGNAQDYAINRIPSRRRNEVICSILEKCKLMEKSGTGFDKIVNEYSFAPIEYQPKVYSDPAQFIITLYDLSYKKENNSGFVNKKISFKKPKKGKREYDSKILLYCLDEPKTRLEIQNYINLSDRKYFVSSILNPLIDFGLLLTTQKSSRAPNQQYYTNPKKVVLK